MIEAGFEFEASGESRLDAAIRRHLSLSVKAAKDLIKSGVLRVNGHLVKKPAFWIYPGDKVRISELPAAERAAPVRRERREWRLERLYEDDRVLVVNKPSGLLSVPATGSRESSAKTILEEQSGKALFSVHRLDRDASGILLFAKDFKTREALMGEFKKKRVKKAYLAAVALRDEEIEPTGRIDIPLDDPDPWGKVISHRGKPACTDYKILEKKNGFALVKARTRTGRRHQVRVHLAETLGPICGDKLYGKAPAPRLALHAAFLDFIHPESGAHIRIEAPLTDEILALLRKPAL